MRRVAGALGILLLAGCSLPPAQPAPLAPSGVTQPTLGTTSPGPIAAGPGSTAQRTAGPTAPPTAQPTGRPTSRPNSAARTPLVLATHPSRPRLDVPVGVARRVLTGSVRDWRALGAPAGPLRLLRAPTVEAPRVRRAASAAAALAAVRRDPSVLALVPASAVDVGTRPARVGGVDPLRHPGRYPLRTPGPPPPAGGPVRLTVVGDLMLGRRVAQANAADPAAPLRPLARRLASADLTIGNLESTLSRAGRPRQGDDSFAADPAVLPGLRAAGFDVLGLANNHVGDFGPRALVTTVRRVRAAGLVPVGAGADAQAARAPAVLERGGVRFGVVAFNAIGETPRATATRSGVHELRMPPRTGPLSRADLAAAQRQIRALARRVDVVIALPHWGAQYTHQPVPAQRTVARALIDAGADLVVGSHPHWVQGLELHRGRLIAYSLGNFVFDMDFSVQTQQGVLLEAVLWGDRFKGVDLVPYRMDARFRPRAASASEAAEILADVRAASRPPFSAAGPS